MDIVYLLGGLLVLLISGELLVKGAVNVAYRFKISSLVVGLTVVSFGTSAPELFVSLLAAVKGHPDIAIGNVVGSNIANLGLVLAVTVLIIPLAVNRKVGKNDYPMLFLSTVIFMILVSDLEISRNDGFFLLAIILIYTYFIIRNSRKETKKNNKVVNITRKQFYFALIFIILGVVGLKYGSEFFLDGAKSIASKLGMSDHLIGVTIVAFGTSVPELVTSAVAAFRRQTDISLGNLIGSNIYNIHSVLGITALVTPIKVSEFVLSHDFLWMLGFVVALIPAVYFKKKFNRWDGVILLGGYIAYIFFSFRVV